MPKEKTATPAAPPPEKPALTSLADIQALCAQTKRIAFTLDTAKCELVVRRLTPAEEAHITGIHDAVTPNIIKGRVPDEDRLDITNADYLKRKTEAALKARAQALYWAVPAFSQMKPNLTNLDDITAFVQAQLTEPLLNTLWNATRESGVTSAELVNFT